MRMRGGRRAWVSALLAAAATWWASAGPVPAQEGRERLGAPRADDGQPPRKPAARNRKADPNAVAAARRSDDQGADKDAAPAPRPARETVEADVSTRTIAVTSAFAGTEIIVFGSVVNSRQPSAEAGTYDIIVVLEGMPIPLTVRRKTNVAGLWINTDAVDFESVPSYYAIASTRPIEEIATRSATGMRASRPQHAPSSPRSPARSGTTRRRSSGSSRETGSTSRRTTRSFSSARACSAPPSRSPQTFPWDR